MRALRVLFCLALLATPCASDAEGDLRSAIASSTKGNRKVALARLKRALEAAEKAGAPAPLLEEARAALQGTAEAGEKLRKARLALEEASGEAELAEALAAAKALNVPKGELAEAQKRLAALEKERRAQEKKDEKRRAAQERLAELTTAETVDVAELRAALEKAQKLKLDVSEAQARLEALELAALPLDKRLDRVSVAFGQEKCGAAPEFKAGFCRALDDEELLRRSIAVGEKNCQHPTLTAGQEAPHPNPLDKETAQHFCKYPPAFDLGERDEGGVKIKEFEWPKRIFNASEFLKDEKFKEKAVVNLDLELFRRLAPCGEEQPWLIEFYVHWCPHCMVMMPKLFKIAVALRSANSPLRVGAVNCATEKELCGAFRVMGHPMVGFFYGGVGSNGQVKLFDYSGRDARVNAALESVKQNRDPSWDAGAPPDLDLPKHLYPAEAITQLLPLLPEEYTVSKEVLHWISRTKASGTACAEARPYRKAKVEAAAAAPEAAEPEAAEVIMEGGEPAEVVVEAAEVVMEGAAAEPEAPTTFPGNGWSMAEHVVTPEHRVQDAAQALLFMLEDWVSPVNGSQGFAYTELRDLRAWVALLADGFPASFGFQPALQRLELELSSKLQAIEAAQGQDALCMPDWKTLLRPLRSSFDAALAKWLPSACRTETCRVWQLLHVLSVSAFARGAEIAADAFEVMAAPLARYFTCSTCRSHFLQEFGAGAFDLAGARARGAEGLALWWWRLHSAVSHRLAGDARCSADRSWPPADVCPTCWSGSNATESSILRQLVKQYWPANATVSQEPQRDEL